MRSVVAGALSSVVAAGCLLVHIFSLGSAQLPLCGVTVPAGCRDADTATVLVQRGNQNTSHNRVAWKWRKGEGGTVADFGSPTDVTDYALCVYDASSGVPRLVLQTDAPAGSGWQRRTDTGFTYRDMAYKFSLRGGRSRVQLAVRLSQADLSAVGALDAQRLFDQQPAVTVLLVASNGTCWTSTYSAPARRSTSDVFGDTADTRTPQDCSGQLRGRVVDATAPDVGVANARVTLVSGDASFFQEVRSEADGSYTLSGLTAGRYTIGASAWRRAYSERSVDLADTCLQVDLALGPETYGGVWQIVGDPGETFGGTDSGVLLPDGRIMWCHDTKDPVIFDPTALGPERLALPPSSPTIQGCHAVSLLADGRVLYVGGADQPVYGPGTTQVKLYDPLVNQWMAMPHTNQLQAPRWYPSMAPLPDGGFIAAGGGGLNNPQRVNTSEVLDPQTLRWRLVGNIALGNEVSPIVLLFTGEVLMTHRPPQLYNPQSERWRAAADFVQGNRMPNGDHADHELVMLADGRVVAIGYKSFSASVGSLTEVYDPLADRWSLGASMRPVRSRASVLLLPDQRVLVLGGTKEDASDPTPTNPWGQVAVTDLYDPTTDSWRRLANLNVAREYHALPILIPDGRVVVVGGEEEPGREPSRSVIEIFTPPYLFRGPRPRVVGLDRTSVRRGDTLRFRLERTKAPTAVVLIGTVASTHFMDSGPGRYLDLTFQQVGNTITAQIPSDAARAIPGYYILFVLVDDIPSEGLIVRVER